MSKISTWRLRGAAAVAALAVLAAACGGGGGSDQASDPSPGPDGGAACVDGQPAGNLTMGTFAQPTTLDATVGSGRATNGGIEMAALYDTLVRLDPETGTYEPRLAESLTPDETHTTWTLQLRDGVRFGNGEVVDAEAVKASLELVQREANTTPTRALALNIAEMEVVDPLTLRITLSDSWPTFPYLLAGNAGMVVNARVLGERGDEAFGNDPSGAGAGAYELVRYAPGEEIVLEAKQDWWGGEVCIQELRFVAIPGARATYDAFSVGEVDVALLRDPTVIAEATEAGAEGYRPLYNLTSFLLLNHGGRGGTPPTADPVVRQAIAAAIDPELLDQRANGGNGFPTAAIAHPDSGLGQLAPDLEGLSYDPDRARTLVEQAKADGWDGKLRVVSYNTPDRVELSIAVEAQLEAVGVDVALDNQNTVNEFIRKIRVDGDYDLAVWGIFVEDAAPWIALDGFRSDNPQNVAGYASPEMDAALLQLRHAEGDDEVADALRQVQDVWNESLPAIAWAAAEDVVVWADDVHGLEFSQDTLVFFDRAAKGSA